MAGVDQVGPVALGTVALRADRGDVAFAVLDAWHEAGGRMIDTAAVYGQGESERAIGAWLAARRVRDDVVLLTKGAHPDESDWSDRISPEAIEADLTDSLERLGVGSVDIFLVHRDAPSIPVGEILEPLAAAVASGRIRSFGVSNWTPARLDAATAYAATRGWPPIAWCSDSLSLAKPVGEPWPGVVDVSDAAGRAWFASHPTRLLAWSPTGNGFFAPDADLSVARFDAYRTPANEARRARAAELGSVRGLSATQVAIAWVVNQPFAPVAIVGTRSVAHLREAVRAATVSLTEGELRWLEDGEGATGR